ncbi:MAG TPA: ferric iron reductase [Devosia sp.]|nr:ferric iron reductase [Devosia sp.]
MSGQNDIANSTGSAASPIEQAIALYQPFRTEFSVTHGPVQDGWTTAQAFFDDASAVGAFLEYERSHYRHMDAKTCAALMMIDYCYVFMFATIPLIAGSGLVPDLSPQNVALRMFTARHEHDGESHDVRRADVRFLSKGFFTDNVSLAGHRDAALAADRGALCDAYRRGIEAHFTPLINVLVQATGLAPAALWRLVADAIAGVWLEVGRHLGCVDQARVDAMRVVKHLGSPLYNRQLHFFDLTLHDDQNKALGSWTFRARGGCCRFYTVVEGALCSTCVLKEPGVRNAELLDKMRQHTALLATGSDGHK